MKQSKVALITGITGQDGSYLAEFLLEKGLIHRVESLNAFIGCSNPLHVHELVLLICKKCENVQERSAAGVMESIKTELQQAHFIAHSKIIEIHGLCDRCT